MKPLHKLQNIEEQVDLKHEISNYLSILDSCIANNKQNMHALKQPDCKLTSTELQKQKQIQIGKKQQLKADDTYTTPPIRTKKDNKSNEKSQKSAQSGSTIVLRSDADSTKSKSHSAEMQKSINCSSSSGQKRTQEMNSADKDISNKKIHSETINNDINEVQLVKNSYEPANGTNSNSPKQIRLQREALKKKKALSMQSLQQNQKHLLTPVNSNWQMFLKQEQEKKSQGSPAAIISRGQQAKSLQQKAQKIKIQQKIKDDTFKQLAGFPNTYKLETKIIALDCEMVVTQQPEGPRPELARISIVNYNNHVLMDEIVRPQFKIVDCVTRITGLRYKDFNDKPFYIQIKSQVELLLHDKIIVGHSIQNDFDVMNYVPGDPSKIRDISTFSRYRRDESNSKVSLKKLTGAILHLKIQTGAHCSAEDAQATMLLYKKYQQEIEQEIRNKNYKSVKKDFLTELESLNQKSIKEKENIQINKH